MRLAADTNVLLDLADKVEEVLDAFRLSTDCLILTALCRPAFSTSWLTCVISARPGAFGAARKRPWGNFSESVASVRCSNLHLTRLRPGNLPANFAQRGLLPQFEVHDSRILAEATLLGCAILLTSDAHLRAIDHERLTLLLHPHELASPVIATPREIVRKFFR